MERRRKEKARAGEKEKRSLSHYDCTNTHAYYGFLMMSYGLPLLSKVCLWFPMVVLCSPMVVFCSPMVFLYVPLAFLPGVSSILECAGGAATQNASTILEGRWSLEPPNISAGRSPPDRAHVPSWGLCWPRWWWQWWRPWRW